MVYVKFNINEQFSSDILQFLELQPNLNHHCM